MKRLRRFQQRRTAAEGGFTIAEVLVYLMIASVVIASIYQLLIGQNRLYTKQRELTDVRGTLRAGAALLAWELRGVAASQGDLYSMATNSLVLRSIQGTGIICAEHNNLQRYGIWFRSGEFFSTADDSALVFAAGGASPSDDQWKVLKVSNVWDPVGGGVTYCAWGDTVIGQGKGKGSASGGGDCKAGNGCAMRPTQLVVELTGDVDDVYFGAPIRAFRRVEYGLFQEDGRWWLGRKIGAAAYEKLTGPLSSPTDSGLVFTYYDQAGNVTADSTQVAQIEIIVRGESFGKVRKSLTDVSVQVDTLTTWVSLRG